MTAFVEYSLSSSIAEFFKKTSATREACDAKALALVGGAVVPVPNQGSCSYSVYAGANSAFLVQFRLKSLELKLELAALARSVHGCLVPDVTFHGEMGIGDSEPVLVYVFNRIRGITYLEFILASESPEDSEQFHRDRKALVTDVAQ